MLGRSLAWGGNAGFRFLIVGLVLVVSTSPRVAHAADVEVCAEMPTTELVDEALVRVRAELTAAGFSVEPAPCGEVPAEVGRIEFVLQAQRLEISASSLASNSTMIQVADLNHVAITPEVIAVRAVESLRAVLLQSLRSGELKAEAVSPSVREFAQFKTPEEKVPPPPPQPALKPESPRTASKPSSQARRTSAEDASPALGVVLSVGPVVEWSASTPSWLAGAEARAIVKYHGASLGLVAHAVGGLSPLSLAPEEGRASAWSILLRPGVSLQCGPAWECQLGVLAGYYQVRLTVDDEVSPERTARHGTWLMQGDVIVGRFFPAGFGVLAQVRGGALLDAPVFSSSQSGTELVWGRPLFQGGISVAFRR